MQSFHRLYSSAFPFNAHRSCKRNMVEMIWLAVSAIIHITPAARPSAVLPAVLVHCAPGRIVLLQRHAFVIHGGT
eukprot:COSAG02_NODE_3934_length_6023_cov_2.093011_4_plen_75_part_00